MRLSGYFILFFLILRSAEALGQAAPTITAITLNNPQAAYENFKRALVRLPSAPKEEKPYPALNSCLYNDEEPRSGADRLMANLQSIARRESELSRDLERAGYPRMVWEEPLRGLVRAHVAIAASESRNIDGD